MFVQHVVEARDEAQRQTRPCSQRLTGLPSVPSDIKTKRQARVPGKIHYLQRSTECARSSAASSVSRRRSGVRQSFQAMLSAEQLAGKAGGGIGISAVIGGDHHDFLKERLRLAA